MSLRDVSIKTEYCSLRENIPQAFYIPLLREANLYQRAVGFFSSTALAAITPGICQLVKNGGKIQLIASPRMTQDDITAIQTGYRKRHEIITNRLINDLEDVQDHKNVERLNLLANLIANGVLDIRIAFLNKIDGMYHEKLGIISDEEGNRVAFSGSMNETITGFQINYDSIDVFRSWMAGDTERVQSKADRFEAIWYNEEPSLETKEFPEVKEQLIQRYKVHDLDLSLDDQEQEDDARVEEDEIVFNLPKDTVLEIPPTVHLYDYQREAIRSWADQNFRGIFDMATGTGKTYTGLGAAANLCKLKDHVAVIIVCPYQHLVEQWADDIRAFNVNPIIGYSSPKYRNFKEKLRDAVFAFRRGYKDFFCFVCTNATFASRPVQEELKKLNGKDVLLMADEAHNLGSSAIKKTLAVPYQYRLALSATLDRYQDEEGTAILHRFFGEKCIEYTLERAIREHKLVPYYYYPVVVSLTEAELEIYMDLTTKIAKCIIKKRNGKTDLNEQGKALVIKRARVVAGAAEKLVKLKELMQKNRLERNILVYCGATNFVDQYIDDDYFSEDVRQIDQVSRMLNFELDMHTAQFTSRESQEERQRRLQDFADGEIQALVAIKCLDEGVNIPQIQTAYILASTSNPKEFIQRRGRVLRLYPGKDRAIIYDFITLPRSTDSASVNDVSAGELSLVKKELNRMHEFIRLSQNQYDPVKLYDDIVDAYELYNTDFETENPWEDLV